MYVCVCEHVYFFTGKSKKKCRKYFDLLPLKSHVIFNNSESGYSTLNDSALISGLCL